MSPEAQRIAIAEACGWVGPFDEIDDAIYATHLSWNGKTGIDGHQVQHIVPDYLNDLNAIHDAETAKGFHKQSNETFDYYVHLSRICSANEVLTHSATAAQRAEAFLKAIGKWQTTPPQVGGNKEGMQ